MLERNTANENSFLTEKSSQRSRMYLSWLNQPYPKINPHQPLNYQLMIHILTQHQFQHRIQLQVWQLSQPRFRPLDRVEAAHEEAQAHHISWLHVRIHLTLDGLSVWYLISVVTQSETLNDVNYNSHLKIMMLF